MTDPEAGTMIAAFYDSLGPERGLNGTLFATRAGDPVQILFRYDEEQKALVCRGVIHHFIDELPPGRLAGLVDLLREEERSGTPTAGARFEYDPEQELLVLTRTYTERVEDKAFIEDMQKLADTTAAWGGAVFDRVTDRLHGRAPSR